MRIAVLVSGAFITKRTNGNLVNNNLLLKSKFPIADFYYATWDQYKDQFEKLFPEDQCLFFPEPKLTYHPYLDINPKHYISPRYQQTVDWVIKGGKNRINWTSHHVKQILIHSWLLDTIKNKYDVIVRARFDTFIYAAADFSPYINDTFVNNRVNCFGATRPELFDILRINNDPLYKTWMLDQLIIHNPNMINKDIVNELYDNKQLHAAEFGWYQVMNKQSNSIHINHSGWVNPDCTILDKFYKETI